MSAFAMSFRGSTNSRGKIGTASSQSRYDAKILAFSKPVVMDVYFADFSFQFLEKDLVHFCNIYQF